MSASDLDLRDVDAVQEHFVNAYSPMELKTFHCERVRKMPLSGLDPSMLIGFLCKDEGDWIDFRKRVVELGQKHKTIFTIQDEPPTWPSDSDEFMGLESMSEPDDMDLDEQQEDDGADEPFFDAQHDGRSSSTSPDTSVKGGAKSSEFDTEEDPMGPITPGPNSTTFDAARKGAARDEFDDEDEDDEDEDDDDDDDDDDDWVDPSAPTPIETSYPIQAPAMSHSKSNGSTSSSGSGSKSKSRGKKSREEDIRDNTYYADSRVTWAFPLPQFSRG
jgi:cysteine protease ATG4